MRVGFGCVTIGSATSKLSPAEQVRLIQRSVDNGVNHFDTADAYGNGMSERILGRALRGRRSDVTISTKAGYVFRERSGLELRARRLASNVLAKLPQSKPSGGGSQSGSATAYASQDFSAEHLRAAVDGSLRRLQSDHIDVLLLHGPPAVLGEVLVDLDDLKTSGKVGRFGIGAESLESASAWVQEPGVEVVQLPFGLLDPEAQSEVFPLARNNPIEFWARGVLGGGLLSAATRDISSVESHPKRDQIQALITSASEAGIGIDELAIRWVRSSPHVALLLLGMSSASHLDRNLALTAMPPLPEDVLARVQAIVARDDIDPTNQS